MKKILPLLILSVLLLTSCTGTKTTGKATAETTASEKNGTETKNCNLIEDVTPEMTDYSFWSKDNALILNEEKIKEINNSNPPHITYTDEKEEEKTVYWSDVTDVFSGDTVKEMINSNPLPEKDIYFDKNAKPLSEKFVEEFSSSRNLEAIPETVKPLYAICVDRTVALFSPVNEPFYETQTDMFYDDNASSEILPGEAVIVLNTSLDGKWYFVFADFFTGWVEKEKLAFTDSKQEWEKAQNPETFIVVTGEKIILDEPISSGNEFCKTAYMGMKLALAEESPAELNGRNTFGAYCVKLPSRDLEGKLCFVNSTVAISQDVSEGYLPCTSERILQQSFKFLGHTYGWGGANNSTDCSGMVRQIYRCFGLNLPRNTVDIFGVKGYNTTVFEENATEEERLEVLKKLKPGSLIGFRGHIMVYLGTKDNLPYCLSSCGQFGKSAEKGKENVKLTNINCVLINPLNVVRANGKTWLQNLTTAISLS